MLNLLGSEGLSSSVPESKGADVLFSTRHGLFGVQRKQVPHDFLKSVRDGRLARELSLLRLLPLRLLVLEGEFQYWPDTTVFLKGVPKNVFKGLNKVSIMKLKMDIMLIHSVPIITTNDIEETAFFIRLAREYIEKPKHVGLYMRPGCSTDWGTPDEDDLGSWILQGIPGVGPSLANNIIKSFGAVPLQWACDLSDLMAVPNIGPGRARKMWNALPMSRGGKK